MSTELIDVLDCNGVLTGEALSMGRYIKEVCGIE